MRTLTYDHEREGRIIERNLWAQLCSNIGSFSPLSRLNVSNFLKRLTIPFLDGQILFTKRHNKRIAEPRRNGTYATLLWLAHPFIEISINLRAAQGWVSCQWRLVRFSPLHPCWTKSFVHHLVAVEIHFYDGTHRLARFFHFVVSFSFSFSFRHFFRGWFPVPVSNNQWFMIVFAGWAARKGWNISSGLACWMKWWTKRKVGHAETVLWSVIRFMHNQNDWVLGTHFCTNIIPVNLEDWITYDAFQKSELKVRTSEFE